MNLIKHFKGIRKSLSPALTLIMMEESRGKNLKISLELDTIQENNSKA